MIHKDRKKKKKGIALALAVLLAATVLPASAGFAVEIEPGNCAVTVNTPVGEEFALMADAGIVLDIYQVAEGKELVDYDAYTFSYNEAFDSADCKVETIAAKAKEEGRSITAEEIDDLAQAIAKVALDKDDPVDPYLPQEALDSEIALDPGLYMIIPHGMQYYGQEPDADTGWDYVRYTDDGTLYTVADAYERIYKFAPILVSLPFRPSNQEPLGSGYVAGDTNFPYTVDLGNTANLTDWVYEMSIEAKVGYEDLFGDLVLVKTMDVHEEVGDREDPATVAFTVEVTKNGNEVFSNAYSMIFTKADTQTITIPHLPVNAIAVVTEEYSGGNYSSVGEQSLEVRIIRDEEFTKPIEAAETDFENEYIKTWRGGGSVTNSFTATEAGWPDQPEQTYAIEAGAE